MGCGRPKQFLTCCAHGGVLFQFFQSDFCFRFRNHVGQVKVSCVAALLIVVEGKRVVETM